MACNVVCLHNCRHPLSTASGMYHLLELCVSPCACCSDTAHRDATTPKWMVGISWHWWAGKARVWLDVSACVILGTHILDHRGEGRRGGGGGRSSRQCL